MTLQFAIDTFEGEGSDKDGDFVLSGRFDAEGNVTIDRRYTRTAVSDPAATTWTYPYLGRWDGAFVSGQWHLPFEGGPGGPFEMWPATQELLMELSLREFSTERKLLTARNGVTLRN
jgi:hypothetical protein